MKDMTLRQARAALGKLGFKFDSSLKFMDGSLRFGMIAPEPVTFWPDTFTPNSRHLVISSKNKNVDPATGNCFSVSSSISGNYRKFRHKYAYRTDVKNIFGMGKTLREAVEDFRIKFNTKEYNVSK
jgi:hypothetical protein